MFNQGLARQLAVYVRQATVSLGCGRHSGEACLGSSPWQASIASGRQSSLHVIRPTSLSSNNWPT